MQTRLPSREVVLLGIGHTNAHVLRMWRMHAPPDARLTCISDFPVATYSGMLPGVLAGLYPRERMQIDLVRLASAARARLILGEVTGLDLTAQRLLFDHRAPIPFDALSIGIGSSPRTDGVSINGSSLVPIKPMQTLIERLTARLEEWQQSRSTPQSPLRIVIVGGGAGGVEIAFCLPAFIRRMLGEKDLEVSLVHAGESLIPGARPETSRRAAAELRSRGVDLRLSRSVTRVEPDKVQTDDGNSLAADVVLWATGAAPPELLGRLGLPTDANGFLLTRDTLQTTANAPVFVVGDSGTRQTDPTPKAGVYAVRQGPVLWENIQRTLAGREPTPYEPQHDFLKLLNLGDGRALGEYKGFSFSSRWAWKLKDWIDGRFMDKYQDYTPAMMPAQSDNSHKPGEDQPAMRCAGCGGKVGGRVLSRVLSRLEIPPDERVVVGLASPDDAAVLKTPAGGRTVVTTDFFTPPLDDPWLSGRIAALNAAGDVFAMGARPTAVVASCAIPPGAPAAQEELLYQLLAGSLHEFRSMGASLVGGHTIESSELLIGFTVLAESGAAADSAKSGLRAGDAILLTKPLGLGVLLAAHMQARCPAEAFMSAVNAMLTSNQHASEIAARHGVRAMTDVTGFGLAGHLLEMLTASSVHAELPLSSVPLLPGAAELLSAGVESTLAPSNRHVETDISAGDELRRGPKYAALFDPQTNGGLLIGLPADRATGLQQSLREDGGVESWIVAHIHDGRDGSARLTLL